MDKETLQQNIKEGKVEFVDGKTETPKTDQNLEQKQQDEFKNAPYLSFQEKFKVILPYTTTVPTATPKNFAEQIVLYRADAGKRLYVYYGGTESSWTYATLI